MIGIINFGIGNIQSVKNSLDYLKIENKIITHPEEVNNYQKIILPGVGAFGQAMEKLDRSGFSEAIKNHVLEGGSILGICLGMQLLLDSSEEYGSHNGLGLVRGKVLPFSEVVSDLPIPHVGWNSLNKKGASLLLKDIEDGSSFYFVHSYYCDLTNKDSVEAYSDYGIRFDSVFEKGKIFGCQFHPEKSQRDGLKILENFNNII